MAESKNNFVKSKMNKDLDARIIPAGEYRDALNISVSRSEDDNVGALENVLGNLLVSDFGLTDCSLTTIGHYMDVSNDRIFVFLTNYTDSSPNQLSNNSTGSINGVESYIAYYDIKQQLGSVIVGGSWLNFSKTHPIYGVNLLENLLFWVDNRNQPRKINIIEAISNPFVSGTQVGYYFNEDQISVSKYYPFECISLVKDPPGGDWFESTMKDRTSEWLPIHAIDTIDCECAGSGCTPPPLVPPMDERYLQLNVLHTINSGNNIQIGDRISGKNIAPDELSSLGPWTTVKSVSNPPPCAGQTSLQIENYDRNLTLETGDIVYFQRANPDYDPTWKGDPDFLKDKFARFSYRFKFDDGEYSLIAPFTQIAFVPIQDGYFIGDKASPNGLSNPSAVDYDPNPAPGQESETYRSSIVSFMENKVTDVELMIPSPSDQYNQMNWSEVFDLLKIIEVDILWKSADDQSIKVIETLNREYFGDNITPTLSYNYQSFKPWKTLPTNELTRVSDVVPIRAMAQETSGNRIIYGNIIDRHTSPSTLDYLVNVDEKPELVQELSDEARDVRVEYQNHTLKQNRTYQVGVVLSDRYGRQSDVILSDIIGGGDGKASTIYHEYRDIDSRLITDSSAFPNPSDTWPGDMLTTIWNSTIPQSISEPGYPGLYSVNDGSIIGYQNLVDPGGWGSVCDWDLPLPVKDPSITPGFISFTSLPSGLVDPTTIVFSNTENLFYNGQYVCTDNPILIDGCWPAPPYPTLCFNVICPENNLLGWYSYKIVVKQTEQEYYNVYLPGMLAGYPRDIVGQDSSGLHPDGVTEYKFPTGENERTAHIVLINDNINKVPRDLQEVGPDQQQFRSSVKLFGRVENVKLQFGIGVNYSFANRNYQPDILGDIVSVIGPMTELKLGSYSKADLANPAYSYGVDIGVVDIDYSGPNSPLIPPQFYNGGSNPIIAKVSTKNKIGWQSTKNPTTLVQFNMLPFLSVYETAPVESKLDIYWETSTSGLISDLNNLIINEDSTFPAGVSNPDIIIKEQDPSGSNVSAEFWAEGPTGTDLFDPGFFTTVSLVSVTTTHATPIFITQKFELVDVGPGAINKYVLRTKTDEYLLAYEDPQYTNLIFNLLVTKNDGGTLINTNVVATGIVTNNIPVHRNGSPYTLSDLKNLSKQFINPPPYNSNCDYSSVGLPASNAVTGQWRYPDVVNLYRDGPGNPPGTPPARIIQTGNRYLCPFDDSSYYTGSNDDNYYARRQETSGRGRGTLRGVEGFINAWDEAPGTANTNWISGFYNPNLFWNGEFEATNGIYGSDASVFGSYQTCEEIVFSVPRQYQVSAIIGYSPPSFIPDTDYWLNDLGNDFQNILQSPGLEYVFGRPWCPTDLDPSLCEEVGGGCCLIEPTYVDGSDVTYGNGINPAIPSGTKITDVLKGPTYLAPYPNAMGIQDPTDPTISGNFGEATVGANNNGGNHYWEDLEEEVNAGLLWSTDLLTLQNQPDGLPGCWGLTRETGWYFRECTPPPNQPPLEISFHHGSPLSEQSGFQSISTPGYYNDPLNFTQQTQFKANQFYAENIINSCNPHGTQKGIVKVNDFMHPGRYVVTVRATDKNNTGLFIEWDVPVYIPETSDCDRHMGNAYCTGYAGGVCNPPSIPSFFYTFETGNSYCF